ncbi:MAG TPA: hypothetical protein VGP76_31930 [Planctomycetaceae bacterium]|nr:hypothetical protein [Planctomycetaceae bacterium]
MAAQLDVPATRSRKWAPALAICCLIFIGCGRSKAEREEQAFRDAGLQKVDVAPVAGVVTVDGAAPAPFTLVMLWDPKKPEGGVLRAICDSEGRFEFTSYRHGDGVPPGSYVVLFARFNMARRLGDFERPDLMHNLYNDPDKNASTSEFQITVSPPGKTDYQFNLNVAGAQPANPGAHSITELRQAT